MLIENQILCSQRSYHLKNSNEEDSSRKATTRKQSKEKISYTTYFKKDKFQRRNKYMNLEAT